VGNGADWLLREGADEETDAALQRRYALSWEALGGVTGAKYKAVSLGVSGVADVRVNDQHPRGEGTVDVVVKSTAGLPTATLLEEVTAALDAEIVINHDVLVKGPSPVAVAVDMTLVLLSGDEAATKALAENYIRDAFSGMNPLVPGIGIGEDVIRDRLASGIVSLPGVKKVVWGGSLAGGDLEIAPDALALLESLRIDAEWTDQP
jgi:phage-related baseplate assembly protein